MARSRDTSRQRKPASSRVFLAFCKKTPNRSGSSIKCGMVRVGLETVEAARPGVFLERSSRLAVILLIAVRSICGQAISGSILGVATDSSGGAMVDAQITVVNAGTGLSQTL